jgi:hypothetical protein
MNESRTCPVGSVVIRSHYVAMVDNNRDRSHIAVRPVYAFVEYVFFISLRSYHMLLLSCRLHNMSVYGVWESRGDCLLVGVCKPRDDLSPEVGA